MSHLLPPNATATERNLSLSINRAPSVPIKTLWSPQTCPEGILPWMAWALSVDDWDAAWPIDRKRAAVAESIEVHRRKGTIGALRRALEKLGYEVEVNEATGIAYTFQLLFKVGEGAAGGALIEDAITAATEIALRQKNARSELIGSSYLGMNGDTGGPIIAGASLSGSETDLTEFSGPVGPSSITVTGTLSVPAFPTLDFAAPENGKVAFKHPLPNGANSVVWNGSKWILMRVTPAPSFGIYTWESPEDVASPELVTTWTPKAFAPFPAPTGNPILTLNS